MPSRKVQFAPGEFYHIYNRGNGRQNIFYNDRDMYRFLQAMYISNSNSPICGIEDLEKNKSGYTLSEIEKIFTDNNVVPNTLVKICADCLIPNHFHFFLQEIKENGITRFMQRLGTGYAKYFTTKYDRPGSLFQGRFKAVHIKDDDQLRYLLAYINAINPAQIVEPDLKKEGIKDFYKVYDAVDKYNWSTHQEFMNRRDSIIVDKGLLGKLYPAPEDYISFIKDVLSGKDRKLWGTIDGLTID